ncbi:inhibitor of KinA [Tumebacillus sp. BK434]|uniref:5-oxoprolinase subunit PxpB n=1 Tax=Tumebacillus sp. BK434 TaxID=2512169 RepID=UPI0010D8E103|nr:5-oxoprolinase subunit PxpB [Tumebacillus sp. BK434]TCP57600.1 inhibitor of KinA [Tumebacillus sp. BK434]
MEREIRYAYELYPLGDTAIVVKLGAEIDRRTHERVQVLTRALEAQAFPWLVEVVPSFVAVTVYYDALCVAGTGGVYEQVCGEVERVLASLSGSGAFLPKVVEVPVCYGGAMGPDLAFVAAVNGLTEEEVVRMHTGGEYLVHMIGFAPGFPYLGGMPKEIGAPRREVPRLVIPAGSVGIAGEQTGVYPLATPGGWQLIGRTPLQLFQPEREIPSLLQAGDAVRFRAITEAEFAAWEVEGR